MFSPPNDPQVEQWFQRLNAPLKRLPADERTQIHQEVRQHLEALAAASQELGSSPEEALELALQQFGDPGKFGKRMAREWKLGKTGCRVEIVAIGFGFGLQVLSWLIYQPLFAIVFQRLVEIHGVGIIGILMVANTVISLGGLLLANTAIGRKHPAQAIKGAFYGVVFWSLCYWTLLIAVAFTDPKYFHRTMAFIGHSVLIMPLWLLGQLTVAYLASVTKRGWYKPTWEDFKITLPKRRVAG